MPADSLPCLPTPTLTPPRAGRAAPYLHLSRALEAMDGTTKRLRIAGEGVGKRVPAQACLPTNTRPPRPQLCLFSARAPSLQTC